ncbi:hypothetical protein T484DRAFT_1774570 [Baffinella frigidus]|nr:hypothetical protein T484DRAFT_1774570 [Cryptophyta sp. CCMP2293]
MAELEIEDVPQNVNFPGEEEKILAYWDEIDAFKTSLKMSKEEGRPEFTFYDGPPFATGMPHYGHILAGTIKKKKNKKKNTNQNQHQHQHQKKKKKKKRKKEACLIERLR